MDHDGGASNPKERPRINVGVLVIAAFTAVALAAACGGTGGGGEKDGGGRLEVVAGFFPLAEAASVVGGDKVVVENLTPAGAEPHDLELSTDDVDRLEDADLVLFLGGGFQPAIEEVAGRGGGRALDLLGDEDDPHIWLDPRRMTEVVDEVAGALSELRPDDAKTIRANAATYRAELDALDADFVAGLAECDHRLIVTSHDAFGHLADRYDLEQVSIAGLSPESEPDPARLAALADQVEARGITTVFTETLVSAELAETLAREAGVAVAVLDPLEGLTKAQRDAGASYLSVMRDNLAALRAGLGCR